MATQSPPAALFTTRQVAETEWLIYDTQFPADDSRYVVAHVAMTDDLVEVTCVRLLPSPTRYLTLGDALDDVHRWREAGTGHGSTRPILIPHLPPVG